jgi:hypothetical protein
MVYNIFIDKYKFNWSDSGIISSALLEMATII